jgi:hypothetical protein
VAVAAPQTEVVEIRSIDSLVATGECRPPTFLKVDVEGAEAALLRGGKKTLQQARPRLLIATHSPAVHTECAHLLCSYGYDLTQLTADADFQIFAF